MYSTCIFCSAGLGTNEAIESFPVGSRVAFDAWNGRLWAICPRCGRWNLAPLDERWEAVEAADRLFTDSRQRVHSGNVGLARLRDGTRLVRVGDALPNELAAWRYGGQLVNRRRQNMLIAGAAVATGGALVAGAPVIAAAGVPLTAVTSAVNLAAQVNLIRERGRVIHRVDARESPTGTELVIRRSDLYESSLAALDDGTFGIDLPETTGRRGRGRGWKDVTRSERPPIRLTGEAAHNVVARAMVSYNHRGAKRSEIEHALRRIEEAGGAAAFTAHAALSGAVLSRRAPNRTVQGQSWTPRQILGTFRGEILPVTRYRDPFSDDRPRLAQTDALALEIALHDEAERRALQGELAALEAAWREAEEIAAIADRL